MVDSVSVAVGGELAAWVTDVVVVPEGGCEGEQSESDACAEAGQGAGAVAFESKLAFAGGEDRFDPLAQGAELAETDGFVLAVGAQEVGAAIGHERLELAPGEALVRDDGIAVEWHPFEHLLGDLSLRSVGGGELESDRGAVGGAEQVEPKTPEVARMRAAVAIAGMATELRAPRRFARLPAGDRGRVEQPEPVAERRREVGQVVDAATDLGRERPDALVVARLLGQIGKQMREPVARQREELAIVGQSQQHLRDGDRDELGVANPGWRRVCYCQGAGQTRRVWAPATHAGPDANLAVWD